MTVSRELGKIPGRKGETDEREKPEDGIYRRHHPGATLSSQVAVPYLTSLPAATMLPVGGSELRGS